MAKGTAIQWCDDTVNPTMGCDGCELWNHKEGNDAVKRCYAGVLHDRHGQTNPGYSPTFKVLTQHPGRVAKAAAMTDLRGKRRLDKPWLNGQPRLIFLSDMSDALSKEIGFEYLEQEVIDVVKSLSGSRHVWLWLTKQPRRMGEFHAWLAEHDVAWPSNLWMGTSVTSPKTKWRADQLAEAGKHDKGVRRFLSVEPQDDEIRMLPQIRKVQWVIQGGESGSQAMPFDVAWARLLRDQCQKAKVPYFLKQLGEKPREQDQPVELLQRHGGSWGEWPNDLRLREVPDFAASLPVA
jgi:protein gp37